MYTNVIAAFIINFYIYCKTFPKIQLHFSPKNLSESLTEMHILIKYQQVKYALQISYFKL